MSLTGTLCLVHVVPPSSVCRMRPLAPTTQPNCGVAKVTDRRFVLTRSSALIPLVQLPSEGEEDRFPPAPLACCSPRCREPTNAQYTIKATTTTAHTVAAI